MSRPEISVLLPAHDAASTLGAALRSLTKQHETSWECLLIDDGSRDDSAALAASFARHDPRFRVVTTEHEGLVAALGRGLALCQGRYVARMDADDVMHPARLGAERQALEHDRCLSAVGCHVRLFPRRGLSAGLERYERWLNSIETAAEVRRNAYIECPIAHPALMVRREVLTELGYRDCGWPEDYDLLLRLLAAGHEVGMVPRRLLFWRDSPTRLWRTDPAYEQGRFTACKAHHLAHTMLGERSRYILWGYGATGRALRGALLAHGKQPSHIVEVHPGRVGQRIHGAPVIPPEALRDLRAGPILVSVAGEAARALIRQALGAMGRVELRDYVCCA